MRAIVPAILLAATPLWAEPPRQDDCAITPDRACPVEVLLSGLELLAADPVATAGQMTLLATRAGQGIVAVDVALADGALRRTLPLNLGEGDFQAATGLIADGAGGYLLHLWQGGGTELGLLFVDAKGQTLALMRPTNPPDWPLEISLASAMMLMARQGVLAFDGAALEGSVYRFGLRVAASDGGLMLVDLKPPMNDDDTLGAYLERRLARQIDPVGAEEVRFAGALSAVTTWASDGAPSRLLLRSMAGGEIAFDQRLGDARMDYDYQAARVTLDGRHLAAVRSSVAGEVLLMVFDTTTTQPVFQAPLPQAFQRQLLWLPDGRIAVLQERDGEGIDLLVLDPGL